MVTAEIWSIIYEKPDGAKSGFGRSAWCLSRIFSRKAKTHIVYTRVGRDERVLKERINGINLYGIPIRGSFLTKRLNFYKKTYYLIEKCTTGNPRIFILHGAYSLPLAKSLKNLGIVVYHTFGTMWYETKYSLPERLKNGSLRRIFQQVLDLCVESFFISKVDAVIVPHANAAKEFLRIYQVSESKIIISPYGQDFYERFECGEFLRKVADFKSRFPGKKIILFVGGMDWERKGARTMLISFKEILNKVPSILIMTGKPSKKYLNLIGKLGLKIDEDVLLPGLISDETLALFYASCDVFALPSHHEGFSQPVIEVMAYGKPVVVSPLAGYPVVSNGVNGFIVDPINVQAFAQAIEKLLTDYSLYKVMGKNASLKAKEYSWSEVGFNLLRKLQDLLNKRSLRAQYDLVNG